MSSKLFKLTGALALALTVSFLAACEDDIPGLNGDDPAAIAGATSEVVDSVIDEFFNDNEALNSLDGLGGFIAGITGSPSIVPFGAAPSGDVWGSKQDRLQANAALLEHFRSRRSGDLYVTNIPSALLGVTCIWDLNKLGGQGYVDDPTQTDAPPNGIRFRLYTIDQSTFLPVVPLDDIGLIDIVDLSTTNTLDVDVLAVVGGATLLDYGVSGSEAGDGTFNLDMSGFVSNGTDQLNFSLNGTASATSSSFSYSIDFGAISVSYDTQFNFSTGMSTTTWVITDDANDNDIRIVLSINEQTGDLGSGSGIWFNNTQVAEFQGSDFSFTLVPTENSPLTDQDLALLTVAAFALEFELLTVLEELFFFAVSLSGNFVG